MAATELGAFDVSELGGRFQLLLAILNIARVKRSIAEICIVSSRAEYGIDHVNGNEN